MKVLKEMGKTKKLSFTISIIIILPFLPLGPSSTSPGNLNVPKY